MKRFDDVFAAWAWCCDNANGPCEVFVGECIVMTFPMFCKPDSLNSLLRRNL